MSMPSPEDALRTPEALAEKQYAQKWLAAFRGKLTPEGHRYVMDVLSRMSTAQKEGKDIMEAMKG